MGEVKYLSVDPTGYFWWRRGESNPRPKERRKQSLRAQFVFWASLSGRPRTGFLQAIPVSFPL